MRAGPINLAASRAVPEFLIIDFRKRFELFNHVSFGDFLQWGIAAKAPRKRSNRIEQVKTADHLDCLFVGILGTRTISRLHNRMHEQVPVARQQSPVFAFHYAE